MVPIQLTVMVEDENNKFASTELIGVVQLPCVPFEGMKFDSPDGNCAELPLEMLTYDLRKGMFVGLLCDSGPAHLLSEMIESWRALGFKSCHDRRQELTE